jgi:transcriptional regulator with XRE-family HTH domain
MQWGRRYGEHLEATRIRALLSRAQLARRVNVSEESVRRWERGGRPSPDCLARLIVVLALDAGDFTSLPHQADDLPALAAALRQERYERSISQAQAGQLLGVAQATFAGWEIGRANPGDHFARAIAEFLGVSDDKVHSMTAVPFIVDTTNWPPFGQLIGAGRQDLRMTREELADVLGLSLATIEAWELGYRRPRPRQLPQLAAAVAVSAEALEAALPVRRGELSALGELIQSRQQRLGLRARDIAERATLDETTISHWVHGHHKPTLTKLKRLATALEVPLDVVYRASGRDPAV